MRPRNGKSVSVARAVETVDLRRAAAKTDLTGRRERNLPRTTGHVELADGGRIATECGSQNHDVNLHPIGSLNRVAKVNLREPCSDDEHGPYPEKDASKRVNTTG